MMQSPPSHDRLRGMLLGLAVGDATGTTLEFKPRGSFVPITEMEGGGPFGPQPGQWTDDTSMALCLADSLVSRSGFDPRDQMERYGRWRREGYWSATGSCFDIGNTVAGALRKFEQTGNPASAPTHPQSPGNGSIMRLAPVPMFYHRDPAAAIRVAGESSRTTHGASECVESCRLLAHLLLAAAGADSKEAILAAMAEFRTAEARVQSIARGDFRTKPSSSIRGGQGKRWEHEGLGRLERFAGKIGYGDWWAWRPVGFVVVCNRFARATAMLCRSRSAHTNNPAHQTRRICAVHFRIR